MRNSKAKNSNIAYLYLTATFFIWGSLYVVSKFVLGKIPTVTVSFFRFLIAGVTLYLIQQKRMYSRIEKKDYKYIILIGFLGYFVSNTALLLGTKLSSASLASLINSMSPITIMLFAVVLLKEKLTLKKLAGVIMAVTGTYIIIGGIHDIGQIAGIILSAFSVITWSFVITIIRKVAQKYDPVKYTTIAFFIAAICMFPFSIFSLINTPDIHFDMPIIISLLYMGIVCTAFAYVLWNKSLGLKEATVCSMFYPIQPIVSVLLGWILLDESIKMNFIIGSIIIIAGMLLSLIGQNETLKDARNDICKAS